MSKTSAFSYNLVREPWIPCVDLADNKGRVQHLGLRDILVRAHELNDISAPVPITNFAILRLLLAILHRVFGPATKDEWVDLWHAGKFNEVLLDSYFKRWEHRFDLFDAERPFYQVLIPKAKRTTVAAVMQQFASGNNHILFDMARSREQPLSVSPIEAAQSLVTYQTFCRGGTLSTDRVKNDNKGSASHLLNGLCVALEGGNLFQTLMLNMVCYSPAAGEPFKTSVSELDLPAWERPDPAENIKRRPRGYLDLLTLQRRRIQLIASTRTDGTIGVHSVSIVRGEEIEATTDVARMETMQPLRFDKELQLLGLDQDRVIWRDSLALTQSLAPGSQPASTVRFIARLIDDGEIPEVARLRLSVYGTHMRQKTKLYMWRRERMPLPIFFLSDEGEDLREVVQHAITFSERVAGCMEKGVETALRTLRQKVRQDDVRAKASPSDRAYWGKIGTHFYTFVAGLREDSPQEELEKAIAGWQDLVKAAAIEAFEQFLNKFSHTDLKVLKARVKADNAFRSSLRKLV